MALPATVRELTAALGIGGKLTELFYGNEFHPATGGSVGVVSPMTGETLCESGGASDADVGAAVDVSSACSPARGVACKAVVLTRCSWARRACHPGSRCSRPGHR